VISIVAVNYNSRDWIQLLVKSVRKFTTAPHELIIVDNASEDGSKEWLAEQSDVSLMPLSANVGHGLGLNTGIDKAQYRYILVLDADSHLQRVGWDYDLYRLYNQDGKTRLVAAGGGDPNAPNPKPIHACFQFFERRFFLDNGLSFVPNAYDVGRKNYYDTIRLGYNVVRVMAGVKFYPGAYGDEYYFDGKPTIYHHWYSSRMWKKEQIDNYRKSDFEKNKRAIFAQPLVKEILA